MGKLFGTDGVRGIANEYPMTAEMILEMGRAIAHVSKQHSEQRRHTILIGKDTRLSGYMIENALTAGICSMGVDVLLVGPVPTPGIAFLTHSMRADAGIVISASHNPYEDNGIKLFSKDGYKLPDVEEAEIEELVLSGKLKDIRPTNEHVGKAQRIDDALGRYIVFCKSKFPDNLTLEGMRVVLDCSNGATYKVAPIIFKELGAEVISIHDVPNGLNINKECGSQYTDDLRAKVLEVNADVGLAFDGDGDRLIAVDEKGEELTGDHIIAICTKYLKDSGQLTGNQVVTTVMSNFGLIKCFKEMGLVHHISDVGDRYVLEKMKETGAVIGGEQSGHLIFHEHHTTGDGILAALQLLEVICATNKKLSDLATVMSMAPQRLINIDVNEKPPIEEIDGLSAAVEASETELKDDGRVLIRYSGTQNMCRVMVEGPAEEMTNRIAEDLAAVVKRAIG